MEGVAVDHFKTFKISAIPIVPFHYYLSDEFFHCCITTAMNIFILIQSLPYKCFIASFLTTMWYHTYGFTKQYHYLYAIYLLYFITLEFGIIIDRAVGSPVHGKDVVGSTNAIYKIILK